MRRVPPVAWLVAAGFAARVALALRTPVINTDGPNFLAIAEGFRSGNLSAATDVDFHPLYPALVALFGGSETAGWLISAVAGALTVVPLWLLVRALSGQVSAFSAAAIYALHPSFVDVQSDLFADGLFMLLAMCALSGAIRYVHEGRGLWTATVAASLGFLAKSEGLVVVVLTAATLAWGIWQRRSWGRGIGALVLTLAVMGPYVTHLSVKAHRFRYSPKTVVELAAGHVEGEERGKGKWQERRDRHGPLVASVWYTATESVRAAGPVHLLALAGAVALLGRWRDRMRGKEWLAAWIAFYVLCVWWTNFRAGHQVSERYLHPPAAMGLLFLGPFAAWLFERMAVRPQVQLWAARAVAVLVVLGGVQEAARGRRFDQLGYREAGLWILEQRGPGAAISSSVDKVPYYARGRYVAFPAKAAESDFVVFTDKDADTFAWSWKGDPRYREANTFAGPKGRVIRVLARW